MAKRKPRKGKGIPHGQIAALPVHTDATGTMRVLLITSRETRRWVIPKGWPMKGLKEHEAAAQEALEESGVYGRVRRGSLGEYLYWKRHPERFELCQVRVYLLSVHGQVASWREKGKRQLCWFSIDDAADRVEESGLRDLIRRLGA